MLLESTTFFVDRCLGRRVGEALREAGLKIELHDDHFAQTVYDEDWIPVVGDRGWVALTKDKAIRRRPAERQAVLCANLRVFTLRSGNLTSEEMAAVFLKNRLKMARFLHKNRAPFAVRVSASGLERIELGDPE